MTLNSIVKRLENIEKQITLLASRDSNKLNTDEIKLKSHDAINEEMALNEADILFQLYCLQLGIDADDLFGEEV